MPGGGPRPGRGKGGGGGPTTGGGLGMPLVLGGLNIPAIIAAAAAADAAVATQGYAAVAATDSTSVFATVLLAQVLSLLNLLHPRFICGVAMDAEIPRIWLEVCRAPTNFRLDLSTTNGTTFHTYKKRY